MKKISVILVCLLVSTWCFGERYFGTSTSDPVDLVVNDGEIMIIDGFQIDEVILEITVGEETEVLKIHHNNRQCILAGPLIGKIRGTGVFNYAILPNTGYQVVKRQQGGSPAVISVPDGKSFLLVGMLSAISPNTQWRYDFESEGTIITDQIYGPQIFKQVHGPINISFKDTFDELYGQIYITYLIVDSHLELVINGARPVTEGITVLVEQSEDLVNWKSLFLTKVDSEGSSSFIRLRIVE